MALELSSFSNLLENAKFKMVACMARLDIQNFVKIGDTTMIFMSKPILEI